MNIDLVKKAYEHFGGVWPTTGWKNIKKKNRLLAICIESYSELGSTYEKGEIYQAGYGFDKDYWVAVCDKGEFCLYGAFIKPIESLKLIPEEIEANCNVDDEWLPELGEECEGHTTDSLGNWSWCKVDPLKDMGGGEFACLTENGILRFVDKFRPLKTERDKFIDHCMDGALIPCNINVMKMILGAAYDKGARISQTTEK